MIKKESGKKLIMHALKMKKRNLGKNYLMHVQRKLKILLTEKLVKLMNTNKKNKNLEKH